MYVYFLDTTTKGKHSRGFSIVLEVGFKKKKQQQSFMYRYNIHFYPSYPPPEQISDHTTGVSAYRRRFVYNKTHRDIIITSFTDLFSGSKRTIGAHRRHGTHVVHARTT